jgi:hypothetical protein
MIYEMASIAYDLAMSGFLLIASLADEGRGSSSKRVSSVHDKLSKMVPIFSEFLNGGEDWGGMKLAYLIVESKGTEIKWSSKNSNSKKTYTIKGRTFKIKGIAKVDAPFAQKVITDKERKKDKWDKLFVYKTELRGETWTDPLTKAVISLSGNTPIRYEIKVGNEMFIQYVKNSKTKFDYFRIGDIVFWMHLKDANNNDVWFNQTNRLSGRGMTDFCKDPKAQATWRTKWRSSQSGKSQLTPEVAAKNADAVVDFAKTNVASTTYKTRKSCNKTLEITVSKRAKKYTEKIGKKTNLNELIKAIKSKSMASTRKEDLKKLNTMEKKAKGPQMVAAQRKEYNKWRKKNYVKWKKHLSDTDLHKLITDLDKKSPVDRVAYFYSLRTWKPSDVQKTTKKKFTSAPAFDPLPFANEVKRKEHKLYKNLRY